MADKVGRIITFYSYKGGTGRTMALSNVAWILASNGYDVLLIDWDLEAPGLHRYLRPFLVDPELSSTPGLIDFVWDTAQVSMTPAEPGETSTSPEFPSLQDFAVGLKWDFGKRGSIKFIPAGRQDENYAQRVNTFNWDNFYERLGGGKLLQAERDRLRASYDYILIDSRTGVSDTSSICTVQMPDILTVFFTLNRQSINGTAAVVSSVAAAVRAHRNEALPIYPIPTRIENAEADKLDAAIRYARTMFAPYLMHVQVNRRAPDLEQQAYYWKDVETPYVPFYAYEEVPAAFKDEPGSRRGVLAPNERIAYWITDQKVFAMRPRPEDDRQKVIQAYGFNRDETLAIQRKMTAPNSPLFNLIDALHWRFVRHPPWRFLSIAVAALAAILMIGMYSSLNSRIESLTSELQAANSNNTQLKSSVTSQASILYSVARKSARDPLAQTMQGVSSELNAAVNRY
jgi:MinD-like ATPase involved in chromosome partitioning or flagellar assembly